MLRALPAAALLLLLPLALQAEAATVHVCAVGNCVDLDEEGLSACVAGTCAGSGSPPAPPGGLPWCGEDELEAVVARACLYDADGDGTPDGVAEHAGAGVGVLLLVAGAGQAADAQDQNGDGVPETATLIPATVYVGYIWPTFCFPNIPPVCFEFICVVCTGVVVQASDPDGDGVPEQARVRVPFNDVDLVDETVTV